MTHVLAIDQGTTSSRAILFDADLAPGASAQQEFAQIYPASGWVEHDPEDIWQSVLATCRAAMAKGGLSARDIAAIGITNQRETVVLWDRATGKPLHNAIVWQNRRTADLCARLKADGHEAMVQEKTGLLLDPYFSGTKLAWLLDPVEGAGARIHEKFCTLGDTGENSGGKRSECIARTTVTTTVTTGMSTHARHGSGDETLEGFT